ncbi:TlpA family protein disulfide reductase [Mucilaginibacter mali]|uniref:TlpA family protein disulfide reductase n=1 Tax=Mucilaginibacter mali TaxID=2740462 RepID=A0A7D4QNW3_9SPHI|nr:TlpA disulfide reductase family protein [Mucilaginibacter mali]QKJ32810.1 TlpA family protein disulfide reductase [Mucilaginibacter mali]
MNFKKVFALAVAASLSISAFAQNAVKVSGRLEISKRPVKLFKIKEGKLAEIASSIPDNGKFGFLFFPEQEGFYVIGTGTDVNPADNYTFYFKSGDQLDLTLINKGYALNGTLNSKENMVLKQWHDLTDPLYQKAINFPGSMSTFVDYFPQQEEIVAKSKTFLITNKSGNAKFDREMKNLMEMDLINYATNFLNTPRTAHPSVEEYSDFYGTIKSKEIARTTGMVYNYPWGQRVLTSLIMVNMRQDRQSFGAGDSGLTNMLAYVPNDTLKGNIVLDNLGRYKSAEAYTATASKFDKYIITTSQKEKASALLSPLLTYKAGTEALQFTYPDKEGKQVSFASMKGKVVLVDVWATWCGPCRQELPFLKQLEKDLEGQPIQFVSISVDAEKDKDKWLKMIKDDQLGGTQLFAGVNNEFSKYYKINGIPRFLVFDKNGKIVDVDSARPSNAKLKELLVKEAAK